MGIEGWIGGGIGNGLWKSKSESVNTHGVITSGGDIDPDLQIGFIGGNSHLSRKVGTGSGLVMKDPVTIGEAVRQMAIARPTVEDMTTTIEGNNQRRSSRIAQ
jgi:hypothetical protein